MAELHVQPKKRNYWWLWLIIILIIIAGAVYYYENYYVKNNNTGGTINSLNIKSDHTHDELQPQMSLVELFPPVLAEVHSIV